MQNIVTTILFTEVYKHQGYKLHSHIVVSAPIWPVKLSNQPCWI